MLNCFRGKSSEQTYEPINEAAHAHYRGHCRFMPYIRGLFHANYNFWPQDSSLEENESIPEPCLAVPRPRRLTLLQSSSPEISNPSHFTPQQKTHKQSQSLFLSKLPLEIRRNIYIQVFGNRRLHLQYLSQHPSLKRLPDGRKIVSHNLAGWECLCPGNQLVDVKFWERHIDSPEVRGHSSFNGLNQLPVQTPWGWSFFNTSLIYTCRQVYSESIEVLYSTNTFLLKGSDLQKNWEYPDRLQQNSLLPQRLHSITSIEITWKFEAKFDHYNLTDRTWDYVKAAEDSYDELRECLFSVFASLRHVCVAVEIERASIGGSEAQAVLEVFRRRGVLAWVRRFGVFGMDGEVELEGIGDGDVSGFHNSTIM